MSATCCCVVHAYAYVCVHGESTYARKRKTCDMVGWSKFKTCKSVVRGVDGRIKVWFRSKKTRKYFPTVLSFKVLHLALYSDVASLQWHGQVCGFNLPSNQIQFVEIHFPKSHSRRICWSWIQNNWTVILVQSLIAHSKLLAGSILNLSIHK